MLKGEKRGRGQKYPHYFSVWSVGLFFFMILASASLGFLLLRSGIFSSAIATGTAGELSSFPLLTGQIDVRFLVLSILIFALLVILAVWVVRGIRLSKMLTASCEEASHLRMSLEISEILLGAQEGTSIVWDGNSVPLVWGDLLCALGVTGVEILAFERWVQPEALPDLQKKHLLLLERGEPFSLDIPVLSGEFLRASGQVLSGKPILTLRPLQGRDVDVIRLKERLGDLEKDFYAIWDLFDVADQPVWVMDPSTRIVEWGNHAYLSAVGGDQACESDSHLPLLLEEQDWSSLVDRSGTESSFSDCFAGREGEVAARFSVSATHVADKLVCVARNVSTPEQLRAHLQDEALEYTRVLQDCTTSVAVLDSQQRLHFFNLPYAQLWNLDPDWLATKPFYTEILDFQRRAGTLPEQADYRQWRENHLADLSSLSSTMFELQMLHLPDGRSVRFRGRSNRLGGVTLFYEDMTERFVLESQFNALTNTQKEILDTLNEGIAVFSSAGRLCLCNPAFSRVLRIGADACQEGVHVDGLAEVCQDWKDHAEDKTSLWGYLKRGVTTLDDAREGICKKFEDPQGRVVDCAIVPLPGGGALVTLMDITDVARTQIALRERNESLESIDRMRSTFIRHVSYILRVPLNTVIGYTDLLTRDTSGSLNEKQREFAGHILTSSHALLAIVNDILDLATLDAGAMELTYAPVDITTTIQSAVDGLCDRVQEGNLTIRISEEGDLSDFVVDQKRLKQILFNLLSNAVISSHPGGEILLCTQRRGEEVRISVTDTGKGIDASLQASIFKPFESGYSSGAGYRGAGLGLSIVRGLVELHGGYVEIDSEEGAGTTVTCVFPVSPNVPKRIPTQDLSQEALPDSSGVSERVVVGG